MRNAFGMLILVVFGTAAGVGQQPAAAIAPEHRGYLFAFHEGGKENQTDPGYTLYKTGYNQILEEKWDEARETFAMLRDKFPKSDYSDDAAYWSAYAMKYADVKKAVQEYDSFIKNFPKSSYYDDAVADLSELEARMELDGTPRPVAMAPRPPRSLTIRQGGTFMLERSQRDLERQIEGMNRRMRGLPRELFRNRLRAANEEKELDPETRLKLEALYAIGESDHDKDAFTTLKSVALDRGTNVALRAAALDALGEFTNFDVLPIYLEVARSDTSARLQEDAIAFIDRVSKDKDRAVSALINLYNSLPADRKDQRESIFYAVAEIGQEKSVDFLANVARTSKDYDLRTAAVYYLGNIGSDRSRKALFDILKEK
jgi:Outer membrane lipoprotein/HEAT repeats